MKRYLIDRRFLTKETIEAALKTNLYFWWDKEINIINIQYKTFRIQLMFPFILWKDSKGIYFNTLINFSLKKFAFKRYMNLGLQLLGFGICIEYHIPDEEQIALQDKFINNLIKLNSENKNVSI